MQIILTFHNVHIFTQGGYDSCRTDVCKSGKEHRGINLPISNNCGVRVITIIYTSWALVLIM